MSYRLPEPNEFVYGFSNPEFLLEMQASNIKMAKRAKRMHEETGEERYAKMAGFRIATAMAFGADFELIQACMNS